MSAYICPECGGFIHGTSCASCGAEWIEDHSEGPDFDGEVDPEIFASQDRAKARLIAAAPALLSACWAAKSILNEITEEYDWSPSEQLLLNAALSECSIAIRQTEEPHTQFNLAESQGKQ